MAAVVTDPAHETDLMFTTIWFVFVLMAVYFAGIGGAVLVRRKPLIISSGWFISFFILLLAPEMASSVVAFVERIKENAANFRDVSMILFAGMADVWLELLFLLTFSIIYLVFLRIRMRQYTFIGVNEEAIRDAIHYGLQKLEISCKETRAWIKLPELNTRLQIKMRSWGSEGEIKIKDRLQRAFLKKLVKHMRIYFREQNVPTKKAAAIQYLIVGTFVMAFALSEIFPESWINIF